MMKMHPGGIEVNPGEEQLIQGNGGGISAHISVIRKMKEK